MSDAVAGAVVAVRGYLRMADGAEEAVLARAAEAACGVAAAFLGVALPALWAEVAAPVAQGIVLLTAHLVEHREADVAPPAAVAALWRPFRVMRLGSGLGSVL